MPECGSLVHAVPFGTGGAEMLKVGIVGAGDVFDHHRRGWSGLEGFELAGVFDTDAQVMEHRASVAGLRTYPEVAELVAACDVVDVCTPPDSHASIALEAIEAGCHLLIEKPVTLRLHEWEEVAGFARDRGVKVGALHNQKFFEVNQRARRWLQEGRIGQLIRVHDEYMVTPEKEWMLGQRGHWSHSLPGGRWLETLPHNLYLLHHLAGPHELSSVEVRPSAGATSGTGAGEVVLTLAGERSLATIHFSANCALDRRGMTLLGEEGVIEVVPPGRVATCSRMASSTLKKALGLPFLDAASKLVQMVPDRIRFLTDRLGRGAHGRNIHAFARHLTANAHNPTPWDEIAYTIRVAEEVGEQIELRLEGLRPKEGGSSPVQPGKG
jgi:predicted dehydrogenase